jgi:flagellar protein FliO/FliZ
VDTYARFLIALIFVLALIGLMAWLARRYGLGGAIRVTGAKGRRLKLIEAMPLDAKRRLVLVARDGVEHLLLLGVHGDLAVETGIRAGEGSFTAVLEPTVGANGAEHSAGEPS